MKARSAYRPVIRVAASSWKGRARCPAGASTSRSRSSTPSTVVGPSRSRPFITSRTTTGTCRPVAPSFVAEPAGDGIDPRFPKRFARRNNTCATLPSGSAPTSPPEEKTMHAPFRIATTGGSFNAYVARPQKLPAPAIVVIHEVFGVNADMRQTCDRTRGARLPGCLPRSVLADRAGPRPLRPHASGARASPGPVQRLRSRCGCERHRRHRTGHPCDAGGHGQDRCGRLLPGRPAGLPHGRACETRRNGGVLPRQRGQACPRSETGSPTH